VQWSREIEDAFHQLCSALSHVSHLYVHNSSDSFVVHTDASIYSIGATLNVTRNGNEVPVAFFTKQLHRSQHNYSATELEELAVLKAIYYFSRFLYGRYFQVVTDHKALCSLMTSRGPNKRLQGWALKLQDFHFDISYRERALNANADALSRQAWPKSPLSGDDMADRPRTVSSEGGMWGQAHKEKRKEKATLIKYIVN